MRPDVHPANGLPFVSISGNVPNVVISDLSFHHADRLLYGATYGRGIWRINVDEESFPHEQPDHTTPGDAPPSTGLFPDESVPAPVLISPDDGAVIKYPDTALSWGPVTAAFRYLIVVVYDGGHVQQLSSRYPTVRFRAKSPGAATWQVWAVLPDRRCSPGSGRRTLHYSTHENPHS